MTTTRQAVFPRAAVLDLQGLRQAAARLIARLAAVRPRQVTRAVESTTLHLNKGATTWIVAPLGRRVSCETGALWLCFDGEPQDIVLEPGQTHCCQKASPLSIHALAAGEVRLA